MCVKFDKEYAVVSHLQCGTKSWCSRCTYRSWVDFFSLVTRDGTEWPFMYWCL